MIEAGQSQIESDQKTDKNIEKCGVIFFQKMLNLFVAYLNASVMNWISDLSYQIHQRSEMFLNGPNPASFVYFRSFHMAI